MKELSPELSTVLEEAKKRSKEKDFILRNVTTSNDMLEKFLDYSNEFDPWRLHILDRHKDEDVDYNTGRSASLYFDPQSNTSMLVYLRGYGFRMDGTIIKSLNHIKYNLDLNDVKEEDIFSLSTMYDEIELILRYKELILKLEELRLKLKVRIRDAAIREPNIKEKKDYYYGKNYDLRSLL